MIFLTRSKLHHKLARRNHFQFDTKSSPGSFSQIWRDIQNNTSSIFKKEIIFINTTTNMAEVAASKKKYHQGRWRAAPSLESTEYERCQLKPNLLSLWSYWLFYCWINATGHDIKSLLINLATIFLLALPFAIYKDRENTQKYFMFVGGSFLVAFLAPPIGRYRPHPYSDWVGNKPFTLRE